VSDDEIMARLAKRRDVEKRADDDPTALATRLSAYRQQTAPVLDWYQARNLLHRIPAVGSVQEIADRVRKSLGR
jgi:adenylate kinase